MSWSRMLAPVLLALYTTAGAANAEKFTVLSAAPDNATTPASDMLFIVSADKATFNSPYSLQLANVTSTVQFNGAGARTGIINTEYFMNGTMGGPYVNLQGDWLGAPDAVLYGISAAGQYKAILLSLNAPTYDADTDVLTFTARVIAPNATDAATGLKLSGGAANAVAADRSADAKVGLLTSAEPELALTDAALFIDSTTSALSPSGGTKYWSVGWGGFGAGCFWGGCYISFGR